MTKLYTTLIMLAISMQSFGQISLDATMAPPVNTMMLFYDANVPSPPFTYATSGTTNTWDFTGLTASPVDDDTVYYLSPSDFPQASAFPSATHATYEAGDGAITLIQLTSNDATMLGSITDPFSTGTSIAIAANPPAVAMTFPYGYGESNNFTTSFDVYTTGATIGQPLVDSVHFKSTTTVNASMIAAGTMIIPAGSFSCLLERQINSGIDSLFMKGAATANQWVLAPNFPTTSLDSSFKWYSDQSLEPYAHALYDDTGLHDVHYFKSSMTTGIENVATKKQVNVFPNPTRDFLGVKGLDLPAVSEWRIYNASGAEIMNGKSNLNYINVQTIAQGSYVLRLITPSGASHDVKFVKN